MTQQWVTPARSATAVERPILRDLIGVGVYVNSVWDLVATAAPYGRARRVLEMHAARGGYDDHVMRGLELALERLAEPRVLVS